MRIVVASGATLRNCLSAARSLLELKRKQCEPTMVCSSGRGTYTVTFATGDIVYATIIQHAQTKVGFQEESK